MENINQQETYVVVAEYDTEIKIDNQSSNYRGDKYIIDKKI